MARYSDFTTIRTEGTLFPPDLLRRLRDNDRDLPGLTADAYHLVGHTRLGEAISEAWNKLQGAWATFQDARSTIPEGSPGTAVTRDRWLLPVFQVLDYGRLQTTTARETSGKSYPISHAWTHVPIHLVGCNVDLDKRTAGVAGAARQSPHGLVQAYLNDTDDCLWGVVSNGLKLRLLRDNHSLTRQAYLEFDLEAMLTGEVFSDFVLLYLVLHQSRLESDKPENTFLERWMRLAQEQGTRALDRLSDGVQRALTALGKGFLEHPNNTQLRTALKTGTLTPQDYYRQLLRVVYRFLVLFAAEDRNLLHPPSASEEAKQRYTSYYSTRRLRDLADAIPGGRHPDQYHLARRTWRWLGQEGAHELAIPALGGFLFSDTATPDLDDAELTNRTLLTAIRHLAFTQTNQARYPIDYKNLGAEELGSVYESLLELQPRLDPDTGGFTLETLSGNERKTTGSYYTPSSLITLLLDNALEPVLDDASRKNDPEKAILELKVVDPASGSGHFLIAASHRIARRLAQVRTGDDEPTPSATRTALRDTISHCIYGVDSNEMAAELCKVALWLEALDPGKPLTFLDHHIKTGNSLIGAPLDRTTAQLIKDGVPDEAYIALPDDDKRTTSLAKRRNREERKGQGGLFTNQGMDPGLEVARVLRELDSAPDDDIRSTRVKEAGYQQLEKQHAFTTANDIADAWTAAFFWPKGPRLPAPVTTNDLHGIAHGHAITGDRRAVISYLRRHHRFFHWRIEFADVFHREHSGFDVVLGNPPWERIKLQEQEFFASRNETVAAAQHAHARKKLIAELPETDPDLAAAWQAALRLATGESWFMRKSGRFPLGGVGDVNLYAVFADLGRQLVASMGACALIVQNGLVTGFTYRDFLYELLSTRTLVAFYGFENEDRLFRDVHHVTKFGILAFTGGGRKIERPTFTAHVRKVEDVYDSERRFELDLEEIAALNPNTLTLPTFRWARDAAVATLIHKAAPPLVRRVDGAPAENRWGVEFLRMFDMANDSGLFINHEDIAPRICRRKQAMAELDDGSLVYPLLEGKMFWLYDHRYGTYAGQTRSQANQGVLPRVTETDHMDPTYRVQPRYWVRAEEVRNALVARTSRPWCFAWRDVGPTERTFVGCVVPVSAAGDQAPLMFSTREPADVASLVALLSSLVVDYAARQKSNRMKFFVVEQLPILSPGALQLSCPWSPNLTTSSWLAERVLELTYTSYELEPFAHDLGYGGPPFSWDEDRRAQLQAELDAAVALLYGLDKASLEWLLDSFSVLRKYEERDLNEYRTKRLVLEAFERLRGAN